MTTDTSTQTKTELEAEAARARARGEFVGFLACPQGGGRIVKVAMTSERQNLRMDCPHCGKLHETADAMPRPRRRGESCALTVPDDPAAKPAEAPKLTYITDEQLLGVLTDEDQTAPVVAKALGIKGTATGARLRARSEWLNYEAGEVRIIITRQGVPKPTLLRLAPAIIEGD